MLTSKLTLKQLKKAKSHYSFTKRLDNAYLKLPATKYNDAKKFFTDLKTVWDNADSAIKSWFVHDVEPAVREAFEYFLTKLES